MYLSEALRTVCMVSASVYRSAAIVRLDLTSPRRMEYMHIILRATIAARRTVRSACRQRIIVKNICTMRRFYCGIYLSFNRKLPHQIRNRGAGRKRRNRFRYSFFPIFKVIKKIYEYETIMWNHKITNNKLKWSKSKEFRLVMKWFNNDNSKMRLPETTHFHFLFDYIN